MLLCEVGNNNTVKVARSKKIAKRMRTTKITCPNKMHFKKSEEKFQEILEEASN